MEALYVAMWHVGYVLYRALVVYEKLLVLSRVGAYSMIDCKLWQLRAANCKALSQTECLQFFLRNTSNLSGL